MFYIGCPTFRALFSNYRVSLVNMISFPQRKYQVITFEL